MRGVFSVFFVFFLFPRAKIRIEKIPKIGKVGKDAKSAKIPKIPKIKKILLTGEGQQTNSIFHKITSSFLCNVVVPQKELKGDEDVEVQRTKCRTMFAV